MSVAQEWWQAILAVFREEGGVCGEEGKNFLKGSILQDGGFGLEDVADWWKVGEERVNECTHFGVFGHGIRRIRHPVDAIVVVVWELFEDHARTLCGEDLIPTRLVKIQISS